MEELRPMEREAVAELRAVASRHAEELPEESAWKGPFRKVVDSLPDHAPRPVRLHRKVAQRLVVRACLDAAQSLEAIEDVRALKDSVDHLAAWLRFAEQVKSGEVGRSDDVEWVKRMLKAEIEEIRTELGSAVIWERNPNKAARPGRDRKREISSLAKRGRQIERTQREIDRFELERDEIAGQLGGSRRLRLAEHRAEGLGAA